VIFILLESITFCKVVVGSNTDMAYDITLTNDKGYIITGYTNSFALLGNMYVIKLDSLGNLKWNKVMSGVGSSVIEDYEGNYVIAGGKRVIKLDPNGNILWNRYLAILTQSSLSGDTVIDANFKSIIQAKDSGYFIIGSAKGYYEPDSPYYNLLIVKLNKDGNLLYHKLILNTAGAGDLYGFDAYRTDDKGFIVAGYENPLGHFIVMKYDSNGIFQFGREIPIYASIQHRRLITQVGKYYYFAQHNNFGKMDSSGNVLWVNILSSLEITSIVPTYDKGYAVVGNFPLLSNPQIFIIKFDSLDQIQWSRLIGTNSFSSSAIQTPDSGFVIVGYNSSDYTGNDIFIVKLDKDGNVCSPCNSGSFSANIDNVSFASYIQYEFPFTGNVVSDTTYNVGSGGNLYPICESSSLVEGNTSDFNVYISCNKIVFKPKNYVSYKINIYTADGKVVFSRKLRGDYILDISNFKKGSYILELNNIFRKRFVKVE